MEIRKVKGLYFSGTGTTEKIVARVTAELARRLGAERTLYDFTTSAARQPDQVFSADTLAVVGVGYYHGFAVERGYDVYRPQDCLRNMARYLKYMLTGRKLKVYIADTLCPVLGHVGMLNLVADVTGLECRPGDPVYIPVNPLDRKGMEIEYRPADQEGKPSSRFRP